MRIIYSLLFFLGAVSCINAQDSPEYQVFIFLSDECLISQYYVQTLDSLHEQYSSEEIQFLGVFPNASTSQNDIDSFKLKYGIPFLMVKDDTQSITKRWGAKVTPEVVVVELSSEEVIYQGRIDDAYFRVGKKRTIKTTSELEDVLLSITSKTPVTVENQLAIGCFIQGL